MFQNPEAFVRTTLSQSALTTELRDLIVHLKIGDRLEKKPVIPPEQFMTGDRLEREQVIPPEQVMTRDRLEREQVIPPEQVMTGDRLERERVIILPEQVLTDSPSARMEVDGFDHNSGSSSSPAGRSWKIREKPPRGGHVIKRKGTSCCKICGNSIVKKICFLIKEKISLNSGPTALFLNVQLYSILNIITGHSSSRLNFRCRLCLKKGMRFCDF